MLTAIGDVMRRCYEKGWISTRDGNVSLKRKGSSIMYITPSGVRKNKIEVESLIKIKISENGLVIPEGTNPSGELHMHYLLQMNSSKTQAIVHAHPTHVVAAMYAGLDLQRLAKEFPELGRYTRVGPTVPVLPVISKELGEATFASMTAGSSEQKISCDIVGQDRHGVCAIAGDPWSAYEHIERLDHICEIALKSGNRYCASRD